MKALPDLDALLVALVLCPGTYSRNRFYSMYAAPEMMAVRRRAGLVRSIVAELAHPDSWRRGRVVTVDPILENGQGTLTYVVSALGLRRSTLLTALEFSIVQYAVTRRIGTVDGFEGGDVLQERIETALRGLSPEMAESARRSLENELFDDETDESVFHDVQPDA